MKNNNLKKLSLTEGDHWRDVRASITADRLKTRSNSSFQGAKVPPNAKHSPIYNYIDGHSTGINQAMWDNHARKIPKSYATLRRDRAKDKIMGRALSHTLANHSPEMDKDTHVFHGWKMPTPPKSGSVVPIKGFLSTSVHPKTASSFAHDSRHFDEHGRNIQTRHILRIKVAKGSKHGAYVSHFNDDFAEEKEFLVRPGRKLHIKGKPKVIKKVYDHKPWVDHQDETHFHVWHAELKEHEGSQLNFSFKKTIPELKNQIRANAYKGVSRRIVKAENTNRYLSARTRFPIDARNHILQYTDSSGELNDHMWNRNRDSKPSKDQPNERNYSARLLNRGRKLSHALDKAGPLQKDTVIYHGWKGHNPPPVNASIETKGFLSASVDHRIARNFSTYHHGAKHVLRIKVPAGSKHGAYVGGISSFEGEKEFVIKPKRKLTIKKKYTVDEPGMGKLHIYHAEIKEGITPKPVDWRRHFSKMDKRSEGLKPRIPFETEQLLKNHTLSSKNVNDSLWGNMSKYGMRLDKKGGNSHPLDRHMVATYKQTARKLIHGLNKIDPPAKDAVVYHGWGSKEPIHKGKEIKTKGFLSTSLSPRTAARFSRSVDVGDGSYTHSHVLRLRIPAGSKHGAYIGHISHHPSEKEFLLKPGRKIVVSKRPIVQVDRDTRNKVHFWHAELKEGFLERQDRIQKIHKKLSKDTKSDYGLTDVGSRWTFNKYIHGSSHTLNKSMWNKPDKSNRIARHQATKQFQFARQLTKSMNKSKGMRDDTVVYHGWKGQNDLHVGKEIKTKGFTSTSVDIDTARRFATLHIPPKQPVFQPDNKTINPDNVSHVLRIKLKKNSKHGVYVTPFASGKGYASEKEVLLRPHRKLTITKGPHKHTDEAGNNYHFWHAELKELRIVK